MIKVISSAPIYYDGPCGGEFLNGDGEKQYGPAPRTASGPLPGLGGAGYSQPKKKKKVDIDKVQKRISGVNKTVGDIGSIIEQGKNIFSGKGRGDASGKIQNATETEKPDTKKGMSKTAKVLIGVGIAAVIITLIIVAVKKK